MKYTMRDRIMMLIGRYNDEIDYLQQQFKLADMDKVPNELKPSKDRLLLLGAVEDSVIGVISDLEKIVQEDEKENQV